MSDNPRLTVLMAARRNYPNWSAVKVLAVIDASDPLRQPPSDEAVDAALEAAMGVMWRDADSLPIVQRNMRNALLAALAVMRGEVTTQFVNCTIGDVPAGVRLTEESNPPPDIIEDRLAAVDVMLRWTAEKNRLLRHVAQVVFSERKRHEDYVEISALIDAAFPTPEPDRVWPLDGCIAIHPDRCVKFNRCIRADCPHAGERA